MSDGLLWPLLAGGLIATIIFARKEPAWKLALAVSVGLVVPAVYIGVLFAVGNASSLWNLAAAVGCLVAALVLAVTGVVLWRRSSE